MSATRNCRKKTRAGNVFPSEREAGRCAAAMSARLREEVVAYQCLVCRLWHVGKPYMCPWYKESRRQAKHPPP
jgi:hypothetical protein